MWIRVYHNWKMNFNFKNHRNSCFSYETKASISFIPMRRMRLWYPIMKWKDIIMQVRVYPNWKTIFNSKNGRKRCFSYDTKPSMSFIPMRAMCLWCPIMKWKEIIMQILIYPNWKTNFNSKNGRKRSFSHETKPSISYIPMRGMCLWCPIMK